ncbi:matrix-remodeling-associated protein 7 isoform X2 [Fukomys damarensis]|uniref:matrix-remodeling-associated protein 7 isoform X2 n=1 Tax=Fukomys damarensis TaxID=885580 RepID=UPI00145540D9|nr:matrix-remodeling-associated protein 7 isoform X2 [Fukomys damarensis]XP_033623194.1 matrix-remodeling-associated protein 7 isoform X2 [Fukomys damarensis]
MLVVRAFPPLQLWDFSRYKHSTALEERNPVGNFSGRAWVWSGSCTAFICPAPAALARSPLRSCLAFSHLWPPGALQKLHSPSDHWGQEEEQDSDGAKGPPPAEPEEEDGEAFSFQYSPGQLRGNQYKKMMTQEELEEERRIELTSDLTSL